MKLVLALISLLSLVSCQKDKINLSAINDKEYAEFLMVVESKCLNCHSNYNTTDPNFWVKKGLVVAGEPEKSPLYRSLRGTKLNGVNNMPPLKSPQLTEEELNKIKTWISKLSQFNTNKEIIVEYPEENLLDEQELLSRCYKHFVSLPRLSNSHIKKCSDLINELTLNESNVASSDLRKSILQNFQNFHKSWASEYNFHTKAESWATFELFDYSENSYGFTENLFNKKSKLKDLFIGNRSIVGKRIGKLKNDKLLFKQGNKLDRPLKRYVWALGNDDDNPRVWEQGGNFVKRGELVGFQKQKRNLNRINEVYKDIHNRDKYHVSVDINRGHGGGLLGNPSFLILTYANDNMTFMDGQKHTMRTWSKNVFNDFMCRTLPVLQLYDTYKFVKKDSEIPFQRNNTCMNCHATIDPLAGAMRNITVGFNNVIATQLDLSSNKQGYLQSFIPIDLKENERIFDVPDYARSKRSGTLRYRNFYGDLINKDFNGPDDLGKIIMEQIDPYICFSKRYLEFLTGVQIDLDNLIKNRDYHSAKERYYYNLLNELAINLKQSQNLKSLVRSIVSHPIYRLRDNKPVIRYKDEK